MSEMGVSGRIERRGNGRAAREANRLACHVAAGFAEPVKKNRSRGMTIVEIVIVLAIIGILASIGIPLYNSYRFETMVAQARSDITSMDYQIAQFQADNQGQLPDSLGDIGQASLLDPWGNSYRYLNLTNMKGNGKVRKDKNLVPINSDYDLYSTGKDGSSQSPLTALASRDDIVRASNGRFVGLASDY